jgi:hypothetical protein
VRAQELASPGGADEAEKGHATRGEVAARLTAALAGVLSAEGREGGIPREDGDRTLRELSRLLVRVLVGEECDAEAKGKVKQGETCTPAALAVALSRIDAAESLANGILDECHERHLRLRAVRPVGSAKLADLIGVTNLLDVLRGPAGSMPVDLRNGQDKDAFAKLVVSAMFGGFVADRRHTNVAGEGVGDGGDGAIVLHGPAGRRVKRVEVRTVVPIGGRRHDGAQRTLPPRTGPSAGTGQWRPHLPHSAAPDLLYVIIMWRVRELPSSGCTLLEAARRAIGWVVALDNEETFARMMPWKSKGPTLNPRRWLEADKGTPAFRLKPDGKQTVLVCPPALACAWLPGLVAAGREQDPLAYWEVLLGAGDRCTVGGIELPGRAGTASGAGAAEGSAGSSGGDAGTHSDED